MHPSQGRAMHDAARPPPARVFRCVTVLHPHDATPSRLCSTVPHPPFSFSPPPPFHSATRVGAVDGRAPLGVPVALPPHLQQRRGAGARCGWAGTHHQPTPHPLRHTWEPSPAAGASPPTAACSPGASPGPAGCMLLEALCPSSCPSVQRWGGWVRQCSGARLQLEFASPGRHALHRQLTATPPIITPPTITPPTITPPPHTHTPQQRTSASNSRSAPCSARSVSPSWGLPRGGSRDWWRVSGGAWRERGLGGGAGVGPGGLTALLMQLHAWCCVASKASLPD